MIDSNSKQRRVAVVVAPNWRGYAEKYLADCVAGLRRQTYAGEIKFFMSDNETSEATATYIMRTFPEAELVLNKNNDGFAKGNNDAIRLAMAQKFDYLFLVNMDTVVDERCVEELVKVMDSDDAYGAVQSRLMLHPDTDKVNSLGNDTHFLGFGYCRGYRDEFVGDLGVGEICWPSGAAVMFRREVLEYIGLFDEKFWMYNEDQDLGWRTWLAGYKCVLAPASIVYHKYEFAKSIKQFYWMDRNRIVVMIKHYKFLTLLLISPAFLFMEFGLILFSLKSGWFREKVRVWQFFLSPNNWLYLLKGRRDSQEKRRVNEFEAIKMFSGEIWYQEIDDWKLRAINPVFRVYWKVVLRIIKTLGI